MVPRDVMLRGLHLIPTESMLTAREAVFLYEVASTLKPAAYWVELGSWCGRGLWAAACGMPERAAVCGIDICQGSLPIQEGSNQCAPHGDRDWQLDLLDATVNAIERLAGTATTYLIGDSASYAGGLVSPVDVLVVDAAHEYDSVRRDLDAWLPKMKPGGLVIGHDYTAKNPGVVRAFDERFGGKCEAIKGTRFVRVQL